MFIDDTRASLRVATGTPRSGLDQDLDPARRRDTEQSEAQKSAKLAHPRITIGGGGERRTLPLVARHADVWNCPTYSLALIERKRDAMLRECEKQGRDPATLVFGQQAVVVLVERESELEAAMRIARRRFGDEQWGLDAGGFVGTAPRVIEQIQAKVALGFTQFALFFHDRGERETLDRFARDVAPVFH